MDGDAAQTIRTLSQAAHGNVEELQAMLGAGYLVDLGGPIETSTGPRRTLSLGGPAAALIKPPSPSMVAHPIRISGRGPVATLISVGRTRNNDIVIPDASVSRFHAFFNAEAAVAGHFLVLDAGSRNGTFVNDKPVPTKDSGQPPVLLSSGCRVRFGRVNLTFLSAQNLLDLAKRLGG